MASEATYDVFLSHATQDKPAVKELARRLKGRKLKPFLDAWHLVPGEPWQEALEQALERSQTFAIFLGPGGLGPWQNEEMRDALDIRVRDKSRRVIPVLLPGASRPDEKTLPRFLKHLTWVDFHSGLADPEAFHRLVCGIKGVTPRDGPAVPPLSARPTMIGVPHRNPFFTGREDLLSRLHQQLQMQGISALAQAAIFGLGGIGKTQTAIEYVHRFGAHYRFVLWVAAEGKTALHEAYLSIARELGLAKAQADLESAGQAVRAWLSREADWLLVFDNADDPALVRPCLPSTRTGGKVLLTSRAKSFVSLGIRGPFRLQIPIPEEAVKFLIDRTGNLDAEAAAELAAELGYLPLALEQAAAYIETVGGGFTEYLARYRRQGVPLLEKAEPSTDYPKTVATTWSLSFDAVRQISPASADLLTAAAFLVPDSIPIEIFTLGGSELGDLMASALKDAVEDPLVFWELLEPLERYSLVERLPNDAFKLHRLTQEVIKDSLAEESRRTWVEQVIRALSKAYPWPKDFENWKLCERLQPNANLVSELTRKYKLESFQAGVFFNYTGYFAWVRGDYANAKLLFERSAEIWGHTLGSENLETLRSRSNLAATLAALGDFTTARKLHEQILKVRERVLGVEHPDTLESMNNLAETLRILGEPIAAMKLQEKDLEIRERLLGVEHPDSLTARNNLALILAALGDIAGARKLQEQTLKIRERVLGGEHPYTSLSTWNLLLTVRQLNDSNAEAHLIDKLRWLLDRDEASLPAADQRNIRRELLKLLTPSS